MSKSELAGEARVLDLTQLGTVALADMLAHAGPQGRAEIRKHAKLFAEVNKCRRFNDETKTAYVWMPGSISCDQMMIEYLDEMLRVRTSQGVPGVLSEGYAELLDLLGEE